MNMYESPKKDIGILNLDELKDEMKTLGAPAFRAGQIFSWLHAKYVGSFDEMSNISKDFRKILDENYEIRRPEILKELISQKDGTRKYLFKLNDGNIIESVLMKYEHGNSVCISSQVGCRMGCGFCASTLNGLERNLTFYEMAGQIYTIAAHTGEKISNVVIMGSGEPLDNYDNLKSFIELISDKNGMNLGRRNITVSTCGIVPKIYELANEGYAITLAISLHSPTDELRRQIMPIAKKYSIKQLMDAAVYYYKKTGRRITFEYTLIKDFNDSERCAMELVDLILGLKKNNVMCHVNLIPVNAVKERNFEHSKPPFILNFKKLLERYQINVTIRREMGSDINAACGQLRKSYIDSREQGKVL